MSYSSSGQQQRNWWMLAFWLTVVFTVGLVGAAVTTPKIPTWYAGLTKPWFTPPNWVFAPVWNVLYAAMAVAIWRISWPTSRERLQALFLFIAQLLLNELWSPAFFGLQSPLLGLIVIVPLAVVLAIIVPFFWRLDRLAGILMVPYFLWIVYATALNVGIYALN